MDALMALAIFGLPATVVIVWIYLGHKTREKQLDTIVRLVESGKELDSDLEMLLKDSYSRSYKLDYRSGTVWVAVGLSLFFALLYSTPSEAPVALILVAVGVARFISGYYRWREGD